MWTPKLENRSDALYRAIANELAEAVQTGDLVQGARLPTQRDLARALGVTVTTVTRAYNEAERRGLVTGEIGRGTFVRTAGLVARTAGGANTIDLRTNSLPPFVHAGELLTRAAAALQAEPASLFSYQPHCGAPAHREAGVSFVAERGIATRVDELVVTGGAQHAITVSLLALTKATDLVLTEALTYAGMTAACRHLQLRVEGLPMDQEGLLPDALDRRCRNGARVLYCMPTIQNPTGASMSARRKREIIEIAERYDLTLIEDDSYGFHRPDDRPLAALAPHRVLYIASTSKSLAPGLRIGYLVSPPALSDRLDVAVFGTMVMAPSSSAAIASAWIRDGLATRVMTWKREEINARQKLARDLVAGGVLDGDTASPHIFLRLPEPWRAREFVARAATRGVAVNAAEEFATPGAGAPDAVRVCLGPPADRPTLIRALTILTEVLAETPSGYPSTV